MLIRFRVAGQLDFTNVQYLIVFNTNGNQVEPLPQAYLTGFANFSFALAVGGSATASQPLLFQYYLAPGTTSGLSVIRVTIPPQLINYVPNSGGNPSGGGEFTINFDRSLLYGVNPGGSPTPGAPVATPSPTATPLPNASPTVAPSASPTLNPNVQPTTAAQHVWAINFITADQSGVPEDSVGLGGATDTTYANSIDTTQFIDKVYTKPVGSGSLQNPSAQVQGYEIINSP